MKALSRFALPALLVLLVAACSGSDPTPTLTIGPTPAVAPTPTLSSALPEAAALEIVARALFEAFFSAAKVTDATAYHGLLEADIREKCTVEQVSEVLDSDDALFPDLEVQDVYLNLNEPDRALVQLAMPEDPETSLEGLATAVAVAFPFPMVLEEGTWRLGLPFLPPGEGCPFDISEGSSSAETEVRVTPIPRTLAPQPFEVPPLEPPSGVESLGTSYGFSDGTVTAETLLETDTTPMALLEHYTATIIGPDWSIQHELVEENIASLTWTFRDDADNPGQGILLILTTQPDQRLVRLWVAGVPVGEQEKSLGRESPTREAR